MSSTFRKTVSDICSSLPGSEVSDPWGGGHDAWKVSGKMYACIGAVAEGVSVKCDSIETAEMMKEAGAALHAPYFHKSWVRLPEEMPKEELKHHIVRSYDLIRAKLPASVRKTLAERSETEGA